MVSIGRDLGSLVCAVAAACWRGRRVQKGRQPGGLGLRWDWGGRLLPPEMPLPLAEQTSGAKAWQLQASVRAHISFNLLFSRVYVSFACPT